VEESLLMLLGIAQIIGSGKQALTITKIYG